MNNQKTSDILMGISILTIIFSGYVFFTQNNIFGLAGTQWILIAIVVGIYGIYAKMKAV